MTTLAYHPMATQHQAFGMKQMMGDGLVSVNANPLRPFFGDLPMMPSQGPDSQYMKRIEDLPEYYIRENNWAYLSEVLVGFVGLDNDWTVTLALPLDYDDRQIYKWNIMNASQPLVDHVPHQGAIRLVQYSRSSMTATTNRFAIGWEAEAQMMTTPMGVQGVMQKMQIIKNAIQRTNAMDVMQALVDCHADMANWQRVHGYRFLDRRAMMDQAIMQFGAVQKDWNGLELIVSHGLKWARSNGVDPDMLIVPPGLRTHLTMAVPERTLYMYNGIPHSDGPPALARVNGINVYETPTAPYTANINTLSMFDKQVATGEYFPMLPMGRHPAHLRDIDIYSEDKDNLHHITMMDALKHCARFENGGLSSTHHVLANKANSDRRGGLNVTDMFMYRDSSGKAQVPMYAGQMELTALPDEQLDHTASTAMEKLNPADVAIVDAALQSVNDNQGSDFAGDISFKTVSAKLGPEFQAAFGRVYATLKRCFGEHCAVLSPHRAFFPANDAKESDARRGQANLFYALLLFRVGITGDGVVKDAQVPVASLDSFDYVVAEAHRGTVVGGAEPRLEAPTASFLAALNSAMTAMNAASGAKALVYKKAIFAILTDSALAPTRESLLNELNVIEAGSEGNIVPTVQPDAVAASTVYKSLNVSTTGIKLVPLGQGAKVLVPDAQGKLSEVGQQTRLSTLFDYSHVYTAKPEGIPLPGPAHGRTATLPGQLSTLVGGATSTSQIQRATQHLTGDLLGTEARNAREMEMFQNCPPLLYRENRVHQMDSAVQRACMLSAMFTRLSEESLQCMIREKLHCWWGFIVARPWQRHRMTTLVLMKGGIETGATKWGRATARGEQGAMLGILRVYFTYYSKAIVFNPNNVLLLENAYYNGYYGGCGHRFFAPEELEAMAGMNYMPKNAEANAPALISMMVPAVEELDTHISITGYSAPMPGAGPTDNKKDAQYSSADYYRMSLGLGDIVTNPAELMHYFSRQPAPNTSVSHGFYLYRTNDGRLMEHLNTGHHGPRVGAGCAAVRRGHAKELPKHFPHQNNVFA